MALARDNLTLFQVACLRHALALGPLFTVTDWQESWNGDWDAPWHDGSFPVRTLQTLVKRGLLYYKKAAAATGGATWGWGPHWGTIKDILDHK